MVLLVLQLNVSVRLLVLNAAQEGAAGAAERH